MFQRPVVAERPPTMTLPLTVRLTPLMRALAEELLLPMVSVVKEPVVADPLKLKPVPEGAVSGAAAVGAVPPPLLLRWMVTFEAVKLPPLIKMPQLSALAGLRLPLT